MMTLHPEVSSFLSQQAHGHRYGGKSHDPAPERTLSVHNPSDGSVLAEIARGDAADVDRAVQAAQAAFPKWAAMSPHDRAVLLHRLADAVDRNQEILAEIEALDVGKAITAARGFDVPFGEQCLRYYADLSVSATYNVPLAIKHMEARVHRTPYGVCGFIFPWNFPFTLLQWGVIPALAAGNTVVIKPSEVTPLSTLFMARLVEQAGVPPGVFNVVLGTGPEVGEPLASHPLIRRMSFTGSPAVGKRLGEICGRNLVPIKLELGGKGAAVVFDDVDLDGTAQALAGAITLNTGQVCCTASRWVVHKKIHDAFVRRVSEALQQTKIGPALDEQTQMGPAVSDVHQKRVLGYVERGVKEGAQLVLEGGIPSVPGHEGGYYLSPALLTGPEDNVCYREEIFGPVAYISHFEDEDHAIERVNRLTYGLANSVWTADLGRANRVAERMVAGNGWINAHNVFAYGLPYGGVNLSGIGGGVNSPEVFYDYLRNQTIARPL